MKKLLISTITTIMVVGCGGGGGSNTPKSVEIKPISLPINKDYKSYKIKDIHIKSNNDRTIILWKEYKEEKGCSNSIDCTYSALYMADKLNGNWSLPSKEQDAIKSWDHVSELLFDTSDVALQSDNKAIVVTTEFTVKNSKVHSRVGMFLYKDGSWKPENYIDPSGSLSISPKAAMNSNGDGLVIWSAANENSTPYNFNLYYASYINNSWSIPPTLNHKIGAANGGDINYFYPKSLTFKNGKAFATWVQRQTSSGSSSYHIYGADFDINNNPMWTMPTNSDYLEKDIGFTESFASASDNQGDKVLVWGNWDSISKKVDIYTSKYCNNLWHKPADKNDYINTNSAQEPSPTYGGRVTADMNNNGFAIIAWSQQTSNHKVIYSLRYNGSSCVATTSDNTKALSPDTGEDALYPKVAVNNSGQAALAWIQKYQGKNRIYIAKFDNDTWQKPKASDYIGSNVDSFDIALNDNGKITIAWSEKADDSHSYLYKKEIDL